VSAPAKYSVERWAYIGRRLAEGASGGQVARELGVTPQAVSALRRKLLPPRAPAPPDLEQRAREYAAQRWDHYRHLRLRAGAGYVP